jgi:hypothetical protein
MMNDSILSASIARDSTHCCDSAVIARDSTNRTVLVVMIDRRALKRRFG